TIFVNGIYLFLVPPFLLLLNWKLAIVSLITIPLTVITIAITGKYMRKYWKKTSEAYADISAFQVEMFTHIRVLKAMALEKFVYKKNSDKVTSAINMQLKAG
ncbi:ABC transporter transmembrane domain-containing protein, partial [Arthrospira platensis SPKY1]|nr:ABC transporter transmembrane domain-containing protein [Arthrospira platensis SPKY1]